MKQILKPLLRQRTIHKQLHMIEFSISMMENTMKMDVGQTGLVLRKIKKLLLDYSLRRMEKLLLNLSEKQPFSSLKIVAQMLLRKWFQKDILVLPLQNQVRFLVMKKMLTIHSTRQKIGHQFLTKLLENQQLGNQSSLTLILFKRQLFVLE